MTTIPTIYIAKALETDKNITKYGANAYQALKNIPEIKVVEISNTKENVWCRDFLPVTNAKGEKVQFKYAPSYMVDHEKWRNRIPDAVELLKELKLKEVVPSPIIIDGGNIELLGKKAIVTDRIFRDNNCTTVKQEQSLYASLKKELAVDELIIIPQHPDDFTGHVDGLVRFVNENTVVINDFTEEIALLKNEKKSYKTKVMDNWYYAFRSALYNAGFTVELLPYTAYLNKDYTSAKGIYLNFLNLEELIIMPTFNDPKKDEKAAKTLEFLYNKKIIMVESSELAGEGGVINCVTWS